MHYLQKYKGKSTRHTCPACETIHSFTLYLNGDTHEPIHRTVGICNRETKCGYHYTPKQYFADNPFLSPPLRGGWVGSCSSNTTNVEIRSTPSPLGRAG
ncbi:MAG: PG0870-related protein, partial [Bacteroidales bacterium]